jgi:hypothetical protein
MNHSFSLSLTRQDDNPHGSASRHFAIGCNSECLELLPIVFRNHAGNDEFVEMILDSLAADKRNLERHELRLSTAENVGRDAEFERLDQFGQFVSGLGNAVAVCEGEDSFL